MIEVDKNILKINYQKQVDAEALLYIKTLGARYTGGEIIIDINRTSNTAMLVLLKKFAPQIADSKNLATQEERNKLFSYLGSYYKSLSSELDNLFDVIPYQQELLPYQVDAAKFIIPRQYTLLAAQQGMGKSVMVVTADIILRSYQQNYNNGITLVVSLAMAKHNIYEDWGETWGIDKKLMYIIDAKSTGVSYQLLKTYKYVMINYDILQKYSAELCALNISCIIFDEAHKIKNTKTNAFIESKAIIGHLKTKNPALKIVLMTGTPIGNWADDLYAYLNLCSIELGHNKEKFKKMFLKFRYDDGTKKIAGTKEEQKLFDLLSNFLFRVKHEGNTDTKGKKFIRYAFDTDVVVETIEDLYNKMQSATSKFISKTMQMTINRITGMAKVHGSTELALKLLSQGKKVVIFSYFTDVINDFKKRLEFAGYEVFIADGKVSGKNRVLAAKNFNECEKPCVFLGQTVAAGNAINLPSAYNIILNDLPNTWLLLEQVVFRLIRVTQKMQVNIYCSICRGTCDEKIAASILKKHKSSSDIIDKGNYELNSFYDEQASIVNGQIVHKERKKKEPEEVIISKPLIDLTNIKFNFK